MLEFNRQVVMSEFDNSEGCDSHVCDLYQDRSTQNTPTGGSLILQTRAKKLSIKWPLCKHASIFFHLLITNCLLECLFLANNIDNRPQ